MSEQKGHRGTVSGFFLDHSDKNNIMKWQYKVVDKSITTTIFTPFWEWLLEMVSPAVAPNVLTLCGLICVLNAFYVCTIGMDTFPALSCLVIFLSIFTYQTLDAIDGKQARRIKNCSPIGELFDHAVDNVSTVFMLYMCAVLLKISSPLSQWFIVQAGQFVFLNAHLNALLSKDHAVEFSKWTGPGEALFVIEALFLWKALFGGVLPFGIDFPLLFGLAYFGVFAFMAFKVYKMELHHQDTRKGLAICLALRFMSTLYTSMQANTLEVSDIISDGLTMAIINGDIIVSKMANRQLHPMIVPLVFVSMFSKYLAILLCVFYYCAVFYDLCQTTGLPMFHR